MLNLSVFETFFPEKRPFFLEDSRTFVPPYGNFQLFHSRRIGRSPGRLPLAAGERRLDARPETTILGATKLTGQRSRLDLRRDDGVDRARVRRRRVADVGADGSGIIRGERLIEPATSYNVARIQRDVMKARRTSVQSSPVSSASKRTTRSPAGSTTTCAGIGIERRSTATG